MTSPHRHKAMPEETNEIPSQDAADSERSGDRRLSTCSPSSEVDTAPEQWRSQCLVARIQRDEALNLLRRIARKGEFMDREGLRLTVADWLARRHLSENVPVHPVGREGQPDTPPTL